MKISNICTIDLRTNTSYLENCRASCQYNRDTLLGAAIIFNNRIFFVEFFFDFFLVQSTSYLGFVFAFLTFLLITISIHVNKTKYGVVSIFKKTKQTTVYTSNILTVRVSPCCADTSRTSLQGCTAGGSWHTRPCQTGPRSHSGRTVQGPGSPFSSAET